MAAKIIALPAPPPLDRDPDELLREAAGILEGVVMIGYTKDGKGEFFASSYGDDAETLWLLERAKFFLLRDADEG